MISTIPNWLQIAVDFLNKEFPEDNDVNLCVVYGLDEFLATDGVHYSDARYNAKTETIYLADYKKLSEHYGGANTNEDIAILNLFHEYRHHQQYIYNYKFGDEKDAEEFAMDMWRKYLIYEEQIKLRF